MAMSRITKTEFAAIIITVILLAVAIGFFLGRNSGDSTVILDGAEPAAAVTLPPEAPSDSADEIPEIPESTSVLEDSILLEPDNETINDSGLLDLNTATIYDLEELPEIGPVLAQRILDYREANGGFVSVEELKNVDGIGDKIFESVVNLVEVGN